MPPKKVIKKAEDTKLYDEPLNVQQSTTINLSESNINNLQKIALTALVNEDAKKISDKEIESLEKNKMNIGINELSSQKLIEINDNTNESRNSNTIRIESNNPTHEHKTLNLIKNKFSDIVNLKNLNKMNTDIQKKLELRKLRFSAGLTNQMNTTDTAVIAEAEKKKLIQRAQKFGLYMPELENEKMRKRAERFGLPPKLSKAEEKIKRMKRALRFGIITKEIEEEKKKARIERFGKIMDEEGNELKKKARKA